MRTMISLVNLDEIPPGGLRLELSQPVAGNPHFGALAEETEFEFIAPLEVQLTLVRIGNMVEMRGRLKSRVGAACSRCLAPLELELDAPFELIYARRPGAEERPCLQKEIELTTEDVGLMLFEGDTIDIRQGLYEETLAALPLKPLCSEACRGLCPTCGADLNNGPCHCTQDSLDPRLAKLLALKARGGREG